MQVLVAVGLFQDHRVNLQEKYDHPKPRPQASRPAPSTNPEHDGPQAGEAATDQRVDEPVSVAGEETASTVPEVAGQETESVPAGA